MDPLKLRFTFKQNGQYSVVTDTSDGSTFTFASSMGDQFFQNLMENLNLDSRAEIEHQLDAIDAGLAL